MSIEKIHELADTAESAAITAQGTEDPAILLDQGRTITRCGNRIVSLAKQLEPVEPPVDPGDPGEPPSGEFEAEDPNDSYWLTKIPDELPAGWSEGSWQKTLSTGFGASNPVMMGGKALSGVWTRALHTAPWGEEGTLWHYQGYNSYGLIDDLELWGIGDFVKGREGHGLYVRCVPHLDTTIRNYRCYKNGGQAIQREWRRGETSIPESVWEGAGGTFTVQDCDLRETALIDERSGGLSVRGSWALSLYNTGQHTIVERVRHHNVFSPAPHEGSLFVGFGTDKRRTPTLKVRDNDFYCKTGQWAGGEDSRPIVFLEGVDDAVVERNHLRGEDAYIDVVDNCKQVVVRDMPQDTLVRIKAASGPHNAPIATYTIAKGVMATFKRQPNGGMSLFTGTVLP